MVSRRGVLHSSAPSALEGSTVELLSFNQSHFTTCVLTFRESTAAYMMSIQPLKVAWETESVIRLCQLGSGWESRQGPKGQV